MLDYTYHSDSLHGFIYHYIFDKKTYDNLISKNYKFISSSDSYNFMEHLSSKELEVNRAKAEKILHKVILLNFQYAFLNLHFCLCIIDDVSTSKYDLKLCLYKVFNSTLSILDLNILCNLGIDLIADSCFEDCFNLESIILPNGIIKLGSFCFNYCTNLTSITIPYSVDSLGVFCFFNCKKLKTVTMHNNVTKIGNACFKNCTSLESITLSNSITRLGCECFFNCINLKNIVLPNSISELGESCFEYCTNLESITLSASITQLGSHCFSCCANLREILIPETLRLNTSLNRLGLTSATKIINIKD